MFYRARYGFWLQQLELVGSAELPGSSEGSSLMAGEVGGEDVASSIEGWQRGLVKGVYLAERGLLISGAWSRIPGRRLGCKSC